MLDRTVFYAASGGQPADRGTLIGKSGDSIALANVVFTDPGKTEIAHVPSPGAAPFQVGDKVQAVIDWPCATRACACTPRCIFFPPCCPIR